MAPPRLAMIDGADLVRAELHRRLRQRGAAKRVAFELGISTSQLCRISTGDLPPPEQVAEALGFRRVIRFERAE